MIKNIQDKQMHSFFMPVMGTSFSADSPLKIGKFGINSVISIMDDALCENLKVFYAKIFKLPYTKIDQSEHDYRAKRITTYLDLLSDIIDLQIKEMKDQNLFEENNLSKYFELLPEDSEIKKKYLTALKVQNPNEKEEMAKFLKSKILAGKIEVNIMTKVDRDNFDKNGEKLSDIHSDALSALRGFANSKIESNIVFSAGFNRRLYAYIEQFKDFFPDKNGYLKKKIVLKVSDYRSALIQGKFLAKRGLWVSEYRIESGLNCGGHAFAKDGSLMGPILEEFKNHRGELRDQLFEYVNQALTEKNLVPFSEKPYLRLTVQGGVGTAKEHQFLFDHYQVDAVGWGSPFLLVPEATTVDSFTRELLINAKQEDYYLSNISPLGVKFNTIHHTMSENYIKARIKENKPGSPCPRGHLAFNYEFTKEPLCTASIRYQRLKLKELAEQNLSKEEYQENYEKITEKACLCEDLGAGAYIEHQIEHPRPLMPAICPGPNLQYFSKIMSLTDMVGHIYGRKNMLNTDRRPHVFLNELKIYIEFLKDEILSVLPKINEKQIDHFKEFGQSISDGIHYYKEIIPKWVEERKNYHREMLEKWQNLKLEFENVINSYPNIFNNKILAVC